MTAAEDIALVAADRPLVVDLARVLSLAAHIDVALVRALRTRLLAAADVSTEADLWSSVLVEARGEGELVLRADVRAALWDELRAGRDALHAHWAALADARSETPPLVQLEERLTFHALDGDLAAIDRELRTVIAAMRDEPDRRRNLAAWSAQALDQLPAEVRETEAARILGNVARSWVATPLQVAAMTPAVDSMDLVQSLQPQTAARATLYVRRAGDTLEVTFHPAGPIRDPSLGGVLVIDRGWTEIPSFPTSNPVLIVHHDEVWPLDPRGVTRIPVRGPRVMIGAPDMRRWWLEPEPPRPSLGSIYEFAPITDSEQVPNVAYLVAPDQVVTAARWLATMSAPYLRVHDHAQPVEIVAIDEDADIALLRLSPPAREPPVQQQSREYRDDQREREPLEFDPDVRPGQTWQAFPAGTRVVGTIATAWPGVTIRVPSHVTAPLPPGTPIFSGTKVICHVGSEPVRDGVLHTISARLIQWWLDQVTAHAPEQQAAEVSQTAQQAPRDSRSEAFSSDAFSSNAFANNVTNAEPEQATAREPRVWVRAQRSPEVPRELTLELGPDASIDDLVVVFVGEDDQRRPAAVYRVTARRDLPAELVSPPGFKDLSIPPGAEVRGTQVVALPPPSEELLRATQREIASYAGATWQRDTRELGIHEGLIDLMWRILSGDDRGTSGIPFPVPLGAPFSSPRATARAGLRQLFGPPPSESRESLATLPAVIELPSRISTGGLLGTTLAHDGDVRRFRRHQWGEHEVIIATDGSPPAPASDRAIRVKIRDVETDPRTATQEFAARVFRNPGKDAFYTACRTPPPPFSTEVILGPRPGGTPGPYDLELVVNRVPKVAPAHAHRRGVQFVIAVLDVMDHAGEARWVDVLHIPGSGELDLVDAQQRVRKAGIDDIVISWIDVETDLVERRYDTTADPSFTRIASALGGEVAAVFGGPPAVSDLLTHRFGVARERNGRSITVSPGDLARVSVQATDSSPVCGYVAFYTTTTENRIDRIRVRAEHGVAACELARRGQGFTVGAVIEDEGVILEAFVDARTQARTRASGEANVFLSYSRRDVAVVRAIALTLRSAGIDAYYDELDIKAGTEWDRINRDMLSRSLLFVPFISQATQQDDGPFLSEWVLATTIEQTQPPDARFILPVVLDSVDPRTARVPARFRELAWYPLQERSTQDLIQLIREQVRNIQRGAPAP